MKGTGKTIGELSVELIKERVAKGELLESQADKEEFKQILALNKENKEILNGCSKHNFSIRLQKTPDDIMCLRLECTKCGGEVTPTEAYWYGVGLRHGNSQKMEG